MTVVPELEVSDACGTDAPGQSAPVLIGGFGRPARWCSPARSSDLRARISPVTRRAGATFPTSTPAKCRAAAIESTRRKRRRRIPAGPQGRDGPVGPRPAGPDHQRQRERAGQCEGPIALRGTSPPRPRRGVAPGPVPRGGRGSRPQPPRRPVAVGRSGRAIAYRRAARVDDPAWRLSEGPDRYVSGESSAVAAFVEGDTARPRFADQPLARVGPSGRPTVVSNAETVVQLAVIARIGPGAWNARGAPSSPGPRLVTLVGAVSHPGRVLEIPVPAPLGTSWPLTVYSHRRPPFWSAASPGPGSAARRLGRPRTPAKPSTVWVRHPDAVWSPCSPTTLVH